MARFKTLREVVNITSTEFNDATNKANKYIPLVTLTDDFEMQGAALQLIQQFDGQFDIEPNPPSGQQTPDIPPSLDNVQFDAITEGTPVTGTSLTLSHTVGAGNNRILLVAYQAAGTADTVTGITYGGQAMTKLISSIAPDPISGPGQMAVGVYAMVAPASGANDVVITSSASTDIRGTAISYTGVEQNLATLNKVAEMGFLNNIPRQAWYVNRQSSQSLVVAFGFTNDAANGYAVQKIYTQSCSSPSTANITERGLVSPAVGESKPTQFGGGLWNGCFYFPGTGTPDFARGSISVSLPPAIIPGQEGYTYNPSDNSIDLAVIDSDGNLVEGMSSLLPSIANETGPTTVPRHLRVDIHGNENIATSPDRSYLVDGKPLTLVAYLGTRLGTEAERFTYRRDFNLVTDPNTEGNLRVTFSWIDFTGTET